MASARRKLLVAAGLLLVVVLALEFIPQALVAEAVRGRAVSALREALGLELTVEEVDLDLLPLPSVQLRGVRVANPEGFDTSPLLTVREAVLGLELRPLLRRKLDISEIRVEGLDLSLARNAEGRWNLPSPPPSAGSGGGDVDFQVERLSVSGSRVGLRMGNATAELDDISLRAGTGSGDDYLLSARLRASPRPGSLIRELSGRLNLRGQGEADLRNKTFRMDRSRLSMDVEVMPSGERESPLNLVVEGVLRGKGTEGLRAEALEVVTDGAMLRLSGDLALGPGGPAVNGRANLDLHQPRDLLDALDMTMLDALAKPRTGTPLAELDSGFSLDANGARLRDIVLRLDDSLIQGDVSLEGWDGPLWHITLASPLIDLTDFIPRGTPGGTDEASLSLAKGLADLRMRLDLRADKLLAGEVEARNLRLEAEADQGKLSARTMKASFLRGRFSGGFEATVQEDELLVAAHMEARGQEEGQEGEDMRIVLNHDLAARGTPDKFTGQLVLHAFNPRDLLWTLGLRAPLTPPSLTRARLQADFTGGRQHISVSKGDLFLDGVGYDFTMDLRDFGDPDVTARVTAPRFDLAGYLGGGFQPDDDEQGFFAELLELVKTPPLHSLDLTAEVGTVLLPRTKAGNTSGRLRLDADGLRVTELACDLYGGRLTAEASARLPRQGGRTSDLRVEASVRGERLLAASLARLSGLETPFSGRVDLRADGTATGASGTELERALRGSASLSSDKLAMGADEPRDLGGLAADLRFTSRDRDGGRGLVTRYDFKLTTSGGGALPRGELSLRGPALVGESGLEVRESRLDWSGEISPEGTEAVPLSLGGRLTASTSRKRLLLDDLRAEGAGMRLTGRAGLRGGSGLAGSLDLTASEFSPRETLAALGFDVPPTRDPDALGSASGTLIASWTPNSLEVSNLDATLDGCSFTASLRLPRDGRRSTGSLDLAAGELDLDRYRLPEEKEGEEEPERPISGDLFPWLGSTRVQGNVRFEELKVWNMRFGEVRAKVEADNDELRLPMLSATLSGGRLTGNLQAARAEGDPLTGRAHAEVKGGDLFRFLHGLDPDVAVAAGDTDLVCDLTTRTVSDEILSNLNGSAALTVRDGWISFNKPQQKKETVKLDELLSSGRAKANPFKKAEADFSIDEGVLTTENFKLSNPLSFTATGGGSIDLPGERLKLVFGVKVLRLAAIPVLVQGPFEDIEVRINAAKAVLDTATGLVEDTLTLPWRLLEGLFP
ncbi:AsmA family protein [Desulfohalovibrio reitneri]|uniref:AsmA family protein n=1 Tax=Desulfohalovibrio reitneri TaxID=1307759 RepID=UPI0004A73593|nr:AsmA family protein [Desulfohalovibrio reitneri]